MIAAQLPHSQPMSSSDRHDIAADGYRVLRSISKMALESFAGFGCSHAFCGALAMAGGDQLREGVCVSYGWSRDAAIFRDVGDGLRPSAASLGRFEGPDRSGVIARNRSLGVRAPLAQFVFWLSAC
jgi:hypothetical protein